MEQVLVACLPLVKVRVLEQDLGVFLLLVKAPGLELELELEQVPELERVLAREQASI